MIHPFLRLSRMALAAAAAFWLAGGLAGQGQPPAQTRSNPVLKTPLPQEILTLLANEVSGQFAFNNLVRLAGAPWVRGAVELKETMSETLLLHDLVRGYGIETVKVEKYPPGVPGATFDYPLEGELWTLEPEKRLVARLGGTRPWSCGARRRPTSPASSSTSAR